MNAILALSSLIFVTPLLATESWMTHIDTALKQAQNKNKSVFIEFTGSDWCSPCKAMNKETLTSPEFDTLAHEKLILVKLDFPSTTSLPPEQEKYNQEQKTHFKVSGVPTYVLLTKEGHPYWITSGYTAKTEFLNDLNQALALESPFSNQYKAAQNAKTPQERSELLKKALTLISQRVIATSYEKEQKEIYETLGEKSLEQTLNNKEELEKREQTEAAMVNDLFQKELLPLIHTGELDKIINITEDYIKSCTLLPKTKQIIIIQITAPTYLRKGDFDTAISRLQEAQKLDSQSETGQQITKIIKDMIDHKTEIISQIQQAQKIPSK